MPEKQNGEALHNRYEIRDKETGEVVNEPAYVLRPCSDNLAGVAMFVYGHLSGIKTRALLRGITGRDLSADDWPGFLANEVVPMMDPAPNGECFPGQDYAEEPSQSFERIATLGPGADGSVEYAYKLLESLGNEVIAIVTRDHCSEERKRKATAWRYEKARSGREEEARIAT
jgi:5,10-methenyltetrahydromethanopterin hydrogenase